MFFLAILSGKNESNDCHVILNALLPSLYVVKSRVFEVNTAMHTRTILVKFLHETVFR